MDEPETKAGERPATPEPLAEPGAAGPREPLADQPDRVAAAQAPSIPASDADERQRDPEFGGAPPAGPPLEGLRPMLGVGSPEKPDRLSIEAERAAGRFLTGGLALGLLIVFLFVAIGQDFGPLGIVVSLFAWGVVVGLTFLFCERWPVLQWERTCYRVDDGGIEIESGVVWRSVVNVPRSRVQHTDVLEGPIARRYGLATLVIHTAGRTTSTVSLAGLERLVALRIRDVLAVEERGA